MKTITKQSNDTLLINSVRATNYSVEFFHIYTDEKINKSHKASLKYLREASKAWSFGYDLIVFIDNYNPDKHILSTERVLDYLKSENALPAYWAYEGDMLSNADALLESLTSAKLQKNYKKYIQQHDKYPCSLLSASWYLTRLGMLPYDKISSTTSLPYQPASRLINILPADYKDVEKRAFDLIQHSNYAEQLNNIQDLFIPVARRRKIKLF